MFMLEDIEIPLPSFADLIPKLRSQYAICCDLKSVFRPFPLCTGRSKIFRNGWKVGERFFMPPTLGARDSPVLQKLSLSLEDAVISETERVPQGSKSREMHSLEMWGLQFTSMYRLLFTTYGELFAGPSFDKWRIMRSGRSRKKSSLDFLKDLIRMSEQSSKKAWGPSAIFSRFFYDSLEDQCLLWNFVQSSFYYCGFLSNTDLSSEKNFEIIAPVLIPLGHSLPKKKCFWQRTRAVALLQSTFW